MPFLYLVSLWLMTLFHRGWTNTTVTIATARNMSISTLYALPQLNVGNLGGGEYYVNMSVGSPPQKQSMIIDISKSFSWVVSGVSDLQCNQLNSGCMSNDLYYPAESTTSLNLYGGNYNEFYFDFIDEQSVNGSIYRDTWQFTDLNTINTTSLINLATTNGISSNASLTNDNMVLKNTTFINVDTKRITNGVLGLAGSMYSVSDSTFPQEMDSSLIFLERLKESNVIRSQSYSLWLGNRTFAPTDNVTAYIKTDYEGKLLLGGVDPSFFTGSFYQFNMISYIDSESNKSSRGIPTLPMGPIYMSAKSGNKLNMTSEQFLQPVLLDSSLHGIYLPANAIIQIAIQLGATYVQSLDGWLVPCDIAEAGAHLDFTFDGLIIKVPILDLLSRTFDSTTSTDMHFTSGKTACSLKLYANTNIGFNVLGTAFLKSAYIAVDLEGSMVAIAQARNVSKAGRTVITTISMKEPVSTRYVTTMSVRAIQSGSIPYATHRSNLDNTHLSIYVTSSVSGVPPQFTAMVYSNGLVSGAGRSFYDTSRTSTTTKRSTSQYSFFSMVGALANATATTPINAGNRMSTPQLLSHKKAFTWSAFDPASLVGISAVTLIMMVTFWL